jgi:hypothetical protein
MKKQSLIQKWPMTALRTKRSLALINPTGAFGPKRPSTFITNAALRSVEADPDRRRSILGGSMTAVQNFLAFDCDSATVIGGS